MNITSDTAIDKILQSLKEKEQSTQELAKTLNLPLGTVRSTLSLLTKLGLTEAIPLEKRGKPFRLTARGNEHLLHRAN